ncbi:hypothetical protein BCV72DRAFT_54076 [Rhizopus microsporus var. microsporus]|uniref:Uncharacterized protein n=2 Tax=Rhizopus microsporus TaxID=58291 RepID=A0A2G4SVZ7_RHIZD|nr:uncharacterized protein RHIMIDRAFT_280824 [Rhizopus microsporus ATCC 52813]ORE02338.1 hypothetical protein BCV72DRAFT_54076 [Rhizopus microsporus var. microsporus]PHZ12912.1 hypothetical protein RHIMIDRAFT_280824 [Rhizopus microsporus ATCC 52813]
MDITMKKKAERIVNYCVLLIHSAMAIPTNLVLRIAIIYTICSLNEKLWHRPLRAIDKK